MPRRRSAPEILREVPPRVRAGFRRMGVDLDDPAQARLFVEGVRAAEEQIAAESAAEVNATPPPPRPRRRPGPGGGRRRAAPRVRGG